jgi:hypothetical protein
MPLDCSLAAKALALQPEPESATQAKHAVVACGKTTAGLLGNTTQSAAPPTSTPRP